MRLYEEMWTDEQMRLSKCVLAVGGDGYFVGVKAVGDFSPEKIVLHFAKTQAEIEGENLSIGKYCDGDLWLRGKIFALKFPRGEEQNG